MLPVIAEGIFSLVSGLINRFLPDTAQAKRDALDAALKEALMQSNLDMAQIKVNEEEAKSDSLFVSGGRPAVIWICAFGLAWQCLIQPILLFITSVVGHPIVAPVFDTVSMISMLSGLLGLGAMRSFDKYAGK